MGFNLFKKNIVVGVSVSPEVGLEVAQVDFETKTVLKYGCKQISYDRMRGAIGDMDTFVVTLQDLFIELGIPNNSEVVLNLPANVFNVVDYPASLSAAEVNTAIEEELSSLPYFQNEEPCISAIRLNNSTIQNHKIAYTAAPKNMLIELAVRISELGCRLIGIDTSVNSTINSLIYNQRVVPGGTWLLMIVESNGCKIVSMDGSNFIDAVDERYSIGEVLGDEENYATVLSAVAPTIKNMPSQCLYVVSKTNLISAKVLASKLKYTSQIIHQEANLFATAPFLNVDSEIDQDMARQISLDVIGAAINREFSDYAIANFNLYNESLGDVFLNEQPLKLKFNSLSYELSIPNMIIASIVLAIAVVIVTLVIITPLLTTINSKKAQIETIEAEIRNLQAFLDKNKHISAEKFDEGDEIRMGLVHNKGVYTYYSIVGTEIPKKLWLTNLSLGEYVIVEGQADNLESIYGFSRNIKDYNPESNIKIQNLALASKTSNANKLTPLPEGEEEVIEAESIITSESADFYEFKISNAPADYKKPEASKETEKTDLNGLPSIGSLE